MNLVYQKGYFSEKLFNLFTGRMKTIVFFDFDGTITKKDSLALFIQFAVGKPAYYIGLIKLSPLLIAYSLKLVPNNIAKEKLFSYFFKGIDVKVFGDLSNRYSLEEIDKITRPQAIKKIQWHQGKGHKVVIVSASMESWLKGWCERHNIDLIATQIEVKNGNLTGTFATRNCYGIEKANRVMINYDLSQYDHVYAYGDSRGDKELLALADKSFYKPFRN